MTTLSLLALAALASPPPGTAVSPRDTDPAVRLWMNNDRRYREGDVVRVQVDAERDGYLLVLHYDALGRLRVLFPLGPQDDSRVSAGRRYEVREEGGRGAFRTSGDGTGVVYAAIAAESWRLEDIVRDGRWDYDRLTIAGSAEDPEQEITDLVQGISGPDGFDYDVLDYRVYGAGTTVASGGYGRSTYLYDDFYCGYRGFFGCRPYGFSFGISFGYPYGYGSFYSPYYYDPFYSPYYYDPFYSPYRYRYRPFGYPYYPFPVAVVPRSPRAVISGRPRGYTITPIRPARSFGDVATRAPALTGPTRGVAPRPVDWQRPRRAESRPPTVRTRAAVPVRGPSRAEGLRGTTRAPESVRGGGRSPSVSRGSAPSGARARPPARPRGGRGGAEFRASPPARAESPSRGSEVRSFTPPARRDIRSRALEFRSVNPQGRSVNPQGRSEVRARGPEGRSYSPPARSEVRQRAPEFRSVNPGARNEYRSRGPEARAPAARSYSPPARMESRGRAPQARSFSPSVRSAPSVHGGGSRGSGGRSRRP